VLSIEELKKHHGAKVSANRWLTPRDPYSATAQSFNPFREGTITRDECDQQSSKP